MEAPEILYKIKTATVEDIVLHLTACNKYFKPALDKKLDIQEYSEKIFRESVTFEAWADRVLVGLIASYFNDSENRSGFITSVSVEKKYKGKGIAFLTG